MRAKLLGTLWRFRLGIGTLILLWTLDLLTGSLHPLGFVLSLTVITCWVVFLAVWGLIASIKTADPTRDANGSQTLVAMLLNATAALPFLLPSGLNSVLWGSCSPLLILWITQFSNRDFRHLSFSETFPHLQWIGIATGEGAIPVALACLIGILLPFLARFSSGGAPRGTLTGGWDGRGGMGQASRPLWQRRRRSRGAIRGLVLDDPGKSKRNSSVH